MRSEAQGESKSDNQKTNRKQQSRFTMEPLCRRATLLHVPQGGAWRAGTDFFFKLLMVLHSNITVSPGIRIINDYMTYYIALFFPPNKDTEFDSSRKFSLINHCPPAQSGPIPYTCIYKTHIIATCISCIFAKYTYMCTCVYYPLSTSGIFMWFLFRIIINSLTGLV